MNILKKLALSFVALASSLGWSQAPIHYAGQNSTNSFTQTNIFYGALLIPPKHISTFVTPSNSNVGQIQVANDGVTNADCLIGGGIFTVVCISTGTANVVMAPAGPPGAQGVQGPPGVPGGSLSYPGVTTDGSQGLSVSGNVAATQANFTGSVLSPNMIGYHQNSTAISHNRDQQTEIWATPQDFCPNAGNGITSDADCFRRASRWLASFNNASHRVLYVPFTPNGYYFSNQDVGFLATLPRDLTDYQGSAGYITPAAVGVYFTNGQLTGCAVSGGSGYTPNADLPIQIIDPSHRGSGAVAYVATNSSGTPASTCTIQLAGMNYPQVGAIATIFPLGGDGAAATATLASGVFTGTSVSAGGSGYNDGTYSPPGGGRILPQVLPAGTPVIISTTASSAVSATNIIPVANAGSGSTAIANGQLVVAPTTTGFPANVTVTGVSGTSITVSTNVTLASGALLLFEFDGLVCGTYPTFTPTITSAAVASIAVTAGGSGCTYAGASSATVPLVFGASCGGAQCTLSTPQTPQNMPISVALLSGVSIIGIGNPVINTDWSRQTTPLVPTLNDVVPFGDPWGDQTGINRPDLSGTLLNYNMYNDPVQGTVPPFMSGLTINAQVDLWFAGGEVGGEFDNMTFGGGLAFYAGTTKQFLSGSGHLFAGTTFDRDKFQGIGGIVIGGDYKWRNPGNSFVVNQVTSGGNPGGTYMGHFPVNDAQVYGSSSGVTITNAIADFVNSTNTAYDIWWETNMWQTPNNPQYPYTNGTTLLLSNQSTSCPTTLSYNTRATDDEWGQSVRTAYQSYGWFNCFRGVRGALYMGEPRYSNGSPTIAAAENATFAMRNVWADQLYRPIAMLNAQTVDFENIYNYNATSSASDPYIPSGGSTADIWLMNSQAAVNGTLKDIIGNKGVQSTFFGVSTISTPWAKLLIRNVGVAPVYGRIGAIADTTVSTNSSTTATTAATTQTGIGTHTYRICIPIQITVAGTAGTFQPAVTYIAHGHTFSAVTFSSTVSTTTANNTNVGSSDACTAFEADQLTNIQASLVASGVTGTPTVAYSATVEMLY